MLRQLGREQTIDISKTRIIALSATTLTEYRSRNPEDFDNFSKLHITTHKPLIVSKPVDIKELERYMISHLLP